MLSFDIYPYIHVVGELLPLGHDLLWRRRARLYMEVPAEWPVPKSFQDRMEDGRIPLIGDFRICRVKLIRQDWHEAWRQVSWFYMEMQDVFWKGLFSRGIIVALDSHKINEHAMTHPWQRSMNVRILVPKSMPHKAPDAKDKENSLLTVLYEPVTRYYPAGPQSPEDYDDFLVGSACDYDLSEALFMDDFESIRKNISGILGGGQM